MAEREELIAYGEWHMEERGGQRAGFGRSSPWCFVKNHLKTWFSKLVPKLHVAKAHRFCHCVPAYGRLISGRVNTRAGLLRVVGQFQIVASVSFLAAL